jgi:hypothetical protein
MMRNTLGFFCVGAVLVGASALGGCGNASMSTADMAGGGADMAMAVNPCGSSAICAPSAIMDPMPLELNATNQLTFKVASAPTYSGTVNITVDRASIDALSGGKAPDVNIAVVPASFQLTGGASNSVSINLSTTTAAAAFTNQKVTLHVTDSMDSTKTLDVAFNLTVQPILTVTMTGDGKTVNGTVPNPHLWSTDNGTTINLQVRQRPLMNGVGGTTFRFLNMDASKASHIIHGSGAITHQNTAGTGTAYGTYYEVKNVNDVMNTNTDGFYCHTHGTSASNPVGERFVTFIP